ncbi:hypothetical protein AB0B25_22690 [Nocardia sp. NPDC049190]|uniref:hypothetical protein n=1 Tax=Nocardia sp. NPDC049190 TaxID=3155650 RepID=UPI0033C78AE0
MGGEVIPFRRRRCPRAVAVANQVTADRAALHAELTTGDDGPGCDRPGCTRCGDHPLTSAEADAALEHVSDTDAQRYAAGALRFTNFTLCDQCLAWVPVFAYKPGATEGT